MALQLWMPLMGDLRNQGLSSFNITTLGTISWVNGKLGAKALKAGTEAQTVNGLQLNSNLCELLNGNYSISVWLKPYGTHVHYNGSVMSSGNWNTANKRWAFGVSQDNTKVDVLCMNYNTYIDCPVPVNEWTHIVCARGDDDIVKLYKNGEYIGQRNCSSDPTFDSDANVTCIGRESYANGYFSFNGAIQDLRLYDHCLSEMEVKELAKGLILHYPLNRGGWGQENLLLNTGFQSRYTQSTGWDTTKNGTQLANNWGGYNGGVPNPSTVYHAHLKQVNGEWVYEYIRTANESWLGISQGGLQSKLTAGKTYTFSWEEYRVEGNNYPTGGLYYYKTGATSANFHLGQFGGSSGNILGEWRKFSYTFTAPTDGDYSKNMSWYIYGHSGGNGKMYMRHPKLEEGSIATLWCPNSSDTLATTMGLNSTTEYDCSGFCNNATYSALPTVTSDTPKYNVSTFFGAYNTPKAIVNDAATLCPALSNCTIAWWQKSTTSNTLLFTGQTTSYYIAASNANNYYHGNAGSPTMYRDGVAGTYQNTTGVWHHYVLTGVNLSSWTALKLNSYSSGWPLNGYVSDLRIYATALSASDVKSLYQNCATIDPDGTIRGQIRN